MRELGQPQRELFQVNFEQLINPRHALVQFGLSIGRAGAGIDLSSHSRRADHPQSANGGPARSELLENDAPTAAAEPDIGHLKNEHQLERNCLKSVEGDASNAIRSAAVMNFQAPQ